MTQGIRQHPRALVLAGGGARGAYEAGVLSYLFEHVYPQLPPGFEFDIFSGTSVGAVHAAFAAATADTDPSMRAKLLLNTWTRMRVGDVLRLTAGELLAMPFRALGLRRARSASGPSRVSAWPTQATRHGVPEGEADLLSYLFFDRSYTESLVELGRADAKAREEELVRLLGDPVDRSSSDVGRSPEPFAPSHVH